MTDQQITDHEFAEWTTPDMSGKVIRHAAAACKLCGHRRDRHAQPLIDHEYVQPPGGLKGCDYPGDRPLTVCGADRSRHAQPKKRDPEDEGMKRTEEWMEGIRNMEFRLPEPPQAAAGEPTGHVNLHGIPLYDKGYEEGRADGRAEGIEEAAKYLDSVYLPVHARIVRALPGAKR